MNDSENILPFRKTEALLCASCGSPAIRTTMEEQSFPYGVGDAEVVLHATVPVGTCGACDFSYTDDKGEDARHEAVCRHLGVMTPREVESVRKRLGMSRAVFARLTGLGEASLARWETGALVQNTANDQLLFLMTSPENVERLKRRATMKADSEGTQTSEEPRVVAIGGSGRRFRALQSSRSLEQLAVEGRGFRPSA